MDYDRRSATISGDTTFDENLIKAATGTDLLIHQTAVARPKLLEAGLVFSSVKPSLAVLYHVVRLTNGKVPPPSYDDIVTQVKTNYSGDLVVADDMMSFAITSEGTHVLK